MRSCYCPLWGMKRTGHSAAQMSANDSKRTLAFWNAAGTQAYRRTDTRLSSNSVPFNLHDTALPLALKSIWSAEMYRVRFLLMIMRCLIGATAPVEKER